MSKSLEPLLAGGPADADARNGREGFQLTGSPPPVRRLALDLWHARDLLVVLGRKEFFVRYRRTSFGLIWAIGLPLIQAAVLAVVLKHFVRFKTGGNYPLFIYSGTLSFTFFSQVITNGAGSIVDGQGISTKIYFPRAVFPLTSVIAGLYGFLPSLVVLLGLELAEGVTPGVRTLLILPAAALTVAVASSMSLVFAVLQVYFRDVKFIVQAALIAWFYVTPVFYPLSAVQRLAPYIKVNPTTGFVELFHASTVGADHGFLVAVWWAIGWSALFYSAALVLYRRFDRVCTDLI